MTNHNYDDISDRTISEIKELVEQEDLDLHKLLEAEQDNKDRKTLVSWLNEQIEEQGERYEKEEVEERYEKEEIPAPGAESSGLQNQPRTVFVLGLILGILLGAAAFYAAGGSGSAAFSASEAGDRAAVVAEQTLSQDPRLANTTYDVSVQSVEESQYKDVYVVELNLEIGDLGNRPVPAYVTKTSGLVFFQAIDSNTQAPVQPDVGTGNQTQG